MRLCVRGKYSDWTGMDLMSEGWTYSSVWRHAHTVHPICIRCRIPFSLTGYEFPFPEFFFLVGDAITRYIFFFFGRFGTWPLFAFGHFYSISSTLSTPNISPSIRTIHWIWISGAKTHFPLLLFLVSHIPETRIPTKMYINTYIPSSRAHQVVWAIRLLSHWKMRAHASHSLFRLTIFVW